MFYVFEKSREAAEDAISVDLAAFDGRSVAGEVDPDVDFVDDTLLNTSPHNRIERQLLTGDMVGLALMSGAIIWSAMGAIA